MSSAEGLVSVRNFRILLCLEFIDDAIKYHTPWRFNASSSLSPKRPKLHRARPRRAYFMARIWNGSGSRPVAYAVYGHASRLHVANVTYLRRVFNASWGNLDQNRMLTLRHAGINRDGRILLRLFLKSCFNRKRDIATKYQIIGAFKPRDWFVLFPFLFLCMFSSACACYISREQIIDSPCPRSNRENDMPLCSQTWLASWLSRSINRVDSSWFSKRHVASNPFVSGYVEDFVATTIIQ